MISLYFKHCALCSTRRIHSVHYQLYEFESIKASHQEDLWKGLLLRRTINSMPTLRGSEAQEFIRRIHRAVFKDLRAGRSLIRQKDCPICPSLDIHKIHGAVYRFESITRSDPKTFWRDRVRRMADAQLSAAEITALTRRLRQNVADDLASQARLDRRR